MLCGEGGNKPGSQLVRGKKALGEGKHCIKQSNYSGDRAAAGCGLSSVIVSSDASQETS